MKWRDLLLSSLLTLVVTVLGGLALWYFTKEHDPEEKVVYRYDTAADFGEGTGKLRFVNISIENVGDKAARNVSIVGRLPGNSQISDRRIAFSSGSATKFVDSSRSNELKISIDSLVPRERGTISLIIKDPSTQNLLVKVRSDNALVIPASAYEGQKSGVDRHANIIIFIISVIAAIVLQTFFSKVFVHKLHRKINPLIPDRNNTAFLLMQQGLFEESRDLLRASLTGRGGSSLLLSNYGAAVFLSGDQSLGERLMEAAEAWRGGRHASSLLAFNRAVTNFAKQDFVVGLEDLEAAIKINKREVAWYCSFSELVKAAARSDAQVRKIVDGLVS